MTDPDWEPTMKMAAAIVTNRGGRTCHAAIVSRELGVPCAVGTSQATGILRDGQSITVSCAGGEVGLVFDGMVPFERNTIDLADLIFDGFSIGSNDLTQLTLGLDRDSEVVAHLFDERNAAVKRLIPDVIHRAKGCGRTVGSVVKHRAIIPNAPGSLLLAESIRSRSIRTRCSRPRKRSCWPSNCRRMLDEPGIQSGWMRR